MLNFLGFTGSKPDPQKEQQYAYDRRAIASLPDKKQPSVYDEKIEPFGTSTGDRRMGMLGDKNIGEQLHELTGKVEKTMGKNKKELRDYREMAKFNQNITTSYVANLKIIIDISKLLNGYNEFFDLFKKKLAEIDQELGIPISSDDFEYMKKLTTEQMVQLNETFKKETTNLKKMYSKYGKQKEYEEVDIAEKLFDKTSTEATTLYKNLKTPPPVTGTNSTPYVSPYAQKIGGAKKTKKKPVKKTKK
jgi:hypothetical protein